MENNEIEIWKDVPEFKGICIVSSFGKVRRLERIKEFSNRACKISKKDLIVNDNGHGYLNVRVLGTTQYVHRLVAMAFIERVEGKNQVNHIDGDKANNKPYNLEWCTHKENAFHCREVLKRRNLWKEGFKGIDNGRAKINSHEKVIRIIELKKNGVSIKDIANEMGVCKSTIERIVSRKSHLNTVIPQ